MVFLVGFGVLEQVIEAVLQNLNVIRLGLLLLASVSGDPVFVVNLLRVLEKCQNINPAVIAKNILELKIEK